MIGGISGMKPQSTNFMAVGRQEDKQCSSTSQLKQRTDAYASGSGDYRVKSEITQFTPEMASSLAKKYDIRNMTRNEYGNLLKDLRDSGVISSKEFSDGFGGAVPYNGPSSLTVGPYDDPSLDTWPFGKERADFTKLLRSCAQYCKNFSYPADISGKGKEICTSLSASYDRLLEIFEQIGKASNKTE